MWLIAKRELSTRGRSKGFLVVTGLLFLSVIALALAPSLFGDSDGPRKVTIGLTGAGERYAEALGAGDDELDPRTVVVADSTPAAFEQRNVDVVFDGDALTWEGFPDYTLDSYVRDVVQQATFADRVDGLGLTPAALETVFEEVEIREVRLDGGDDEFGVRFATAGVAGFATFLLLQIWGNFVMMGVVEEKSSKVVEVLLSHVRPSTLLAGKVLGLGILALAQMLIFVLGIVVGLVATQDLEIPSSVWRTAPLLVATFLLGFGFYAAAFAAVGSMVSRQEDAQSAQTPVMVPLMLGYLIAAFSVSSPQSPAVVIGSFVPFTSPVLLPFRTAMTDVPLWQILVSLIVLAVSTVLMLRVAGRIYRFSLLRAGSRVTWREWWRGRRSVDA